MGKRVAFVHTVAFLVDTFKQAMRTQHPAVDTFHILNESLLQDLLRDGPGPAVSDRVVRQAALAADAGAELIVFTCSSTSPAIDDARKVISVPILKIDDPMARQAASLGSRIGLICTTASTVEPSTALIERHAAETGGAVTVSAKLVEGAYQALMAGDRTRHDELVTDAALALAETSDVVVLAQASLAHLQPHLSERSRVPVLASPPLLMEEVRRRLAVD